MVGIPPALRPLTALGVPGFFDRKFVQRPSSVSTGKSESAPCASASPVSVEVPTSAARIGEDFALTASPREILSNLSNTIKEKSGAAVTMPIGQANDALGYMPQSFELSPVGQQGLGSPWMASLSSTTRMRTRSTAATATWRWKPRSVPSTAWTS